MVEKIQGSQIVGRYYVEVIGYPWIGLFMAIANIRLKSEPFFHIQRHTHNHFRNATCKPLWYREAAGIDYATAWVICKGWREGSQSVPRFCVGVRLPMYKWCVAGESGLFMTAANIKPKRISNWSMLLQTVALANNDLLQVNCYSNVPLFLCNKVSLLYCMV